MLHSLDVQALRVRALVLGLGCALALPAAAQPPAPVQPARPAVPVQATWLEREGITYAVDVVLQRERARGPVHAILQFAPDALYALGDARTHIRPGLRQELSSASVQLGAPSLQRTAVRWEAPHTITELVCSATADPEPVALLAFAVQDEPRLRAGELPLSLSMAPGAARLCVRSIAIRPVGMEPNAWLDMMNGVLNAPTSIGR